MYINFELTSTNMVFTLCQEDGTVIRTDTHPLDTYTCDPGDKVLSGLLVVRLANEPKGSWPPKAAYPIDRLVFINTATLPFQTANESDIDLP